MKSILYWYILTLLLFHVHRAEAKYIFSAGAKSGFYRLSFTDPAHQTYSDLSSKTSLGFQLSNEIPITKKISLGVHAFYETVDFNLPKTNTLEDPEIDLQGFNTEVIFYRLFLRPQFEIGYQPTVFIDGVNVGTDRLRMAGRPFLGFTLRPRLTAKKRRGFVANVDINYKYLIEKKKDNFLIQSSSQLLYGFTARYLLNGWAIKFTTNYSTFDNTVNGSPQSQEQINFFLGLSFGRRKSNDRP